MSVDTSSPVRRSVLGPSLVAEVQSWTSEIESWPAGSHVWGHYAERTADGGEAICRTENVSACHAGFRDLVRGDLGSLAASLLGTGVVDFKDKINYKQPGGAGFSPHQDLPAYPGATRVVSLLVAIDECTMDSGCLWMADGVDHLLPTDERGVVEKHIVDHLDWTAVELAPGDVLCIAGLLPHYSEANRSSSPRRVLVASYAPADDGYSREGYYAARGEDMKEATARDGQFRISTLADFEGVEVRSDAPAGGGTCTHG
jgi:2-aminoethylphosphonate dioxygenase